MAVSVFEFKDVIPDDAAVADVLGATKCIWDGVRDHIKKDHKDVSEEWKYYSKSSGWMLVIKAGKRTLIYLIPAKGHFKTNFVFGRAATDAALASDLPAGVIKSIKEARQYVEGRSFMTDVRKSEDMGTVIKLIGIKSSN
jgi:hypothetical protein